MLTTTRKTIKTTRDSVEGVVEKSIEVEIGTNESLDEVPERRAEVEASVADLLVNDAKFRGLDIYQQAEYLELGFIFANIPGVTVGNQHFPRQGYLDLLVAKRDGRLEDKKADALVAKAEREAAAEIKPDEKPAKDLG